MNRNSSRLLRPTFALLLFALAALTFAGAGAQRADWRGKVSPQVFEHFATQTEAEFIVFLNEQADLAAVSPLKGKDAKAQQVFHLLESTARRTQAPLLAQLQQDGADYRAYWIANMIWVRGNRQMLQLLASMPQVAAVYDNPYRPVDLPTPGNDQRSRRPTTVEWNVAHIKAPDVWAFGVTGQNVVVGGQDTGYDWQHPTLRGQYRGWDGQSAEHDYNWHDAIHSGGGSCGADSPEPCDAHGHGTHTMGTVIGDDGAGNQIGVAPGATWIGCRNMNEFGIGSPASYSECFQWFVAPTDGSGENPRPDLAPHVINNSWACTGSEGCDDGEIAVMETVVENVRAAGIVVVASAGNAGQTCGSVQFPPAIYDASFSVGATGQNDTIAPFSSRGPVTVDGSNRLKPDVVAPGVSVRSATPGGGYGISSGTSMAAPHVAGLVALLISADPTLAGDVDAIEALITDTALPLTTMTQNCGGISGETIPNNTYGHGRIDALEAYLQVSPFTFRSYFPFTSQQSIAN